METILKHLRTIKDTDKNPNRRTVADALVYGLCTQRTTINFERMLYDGDIDTVVNQVLASWESTGAKDYISGVMYHARLVGNGQIGWLPVDTGEELPQLTFAPKPEQQLRLI